jgi:hypothetical protein
MFAKISDDARDEMQEKFRRLLKIHFVKISIPLGPRAKLIGMSASALSV